MKRLLFACTVAAASACALAGTGVTQIAMPEGQRPITVLYPTEAADQPVQRDAFTLQLAKAAPPTKGNGYLVAISHGTGGNPWMHAGVARALVAAGFVVTMPEHAGDHSGDASLAGPQSWQQRPLEVSRAISAVLQDVRFAPLLSAQRVGVYGTSAGGHVALSFAGGRWSPLWFRRHCEANLEADFSACAGTSVRLGGSPLDWFRLRAARKALEERTYEDQLQGDQDSRIVAVVAAAPIAADFDPRTLRVPRVPLGIVRAAQDRWIAPRFHADRVLAICQPRCQLLADLPDAGHGALLSPLPPTETLDSVMRHLLEDPPGFDRAVQVPLLERKITEFFLRHVVR